MSLNPACRDHLAVEPQSPPPPPRVSNRRVSSASGLAIVFPRIKSVRSCKHLHPRDQQPTPAALFGDQARQTVETRLRPTLGSPNLPDSMFANAGCVRRQTPSRSEGRLDSTPMKANLSHIFAESSGPLGELSKRPDSDESACAKPPRAHEPVRHVCMYLGRD